MEDEREKEKKASSKSVAILSSSKREADVLISASQCGSISHLEIRRNKIQTHSYNQLFLTYNHVMWKRILSLIIRKSIENWSYFTSITESQQLSRQRYAGSITEEILSSIFFNFLWKRPRLIIQDICKDHLAEYAKITFSYFLLKSIQRFN